MGGVCVWRVAVGEGAGERGRGMNRTLLNGFRSTRVCVVVGFSVFWFWFSITRKQGSHGSSSLFLSLVTKRSLKKEKEKISPFHQSMK